MRQLGSGSQHFYTKSIDRDSTIGNISMRMALSQSAPHTPVSAPSHDNPMAKAVPRLLSEPLVAAKNPSPGAKSLDGRAKGPSPFPEKREEGTKVARAASVCVPVHSPKHVMKKESKFSLRRDTRVQVEEEEAERVARTTFDGTDV